MTLAEMETLGREYVTVAEAASVMGCAPQRLRDGLDIHPEQFAFPHCKVGNRHRIMRQGFIQWAKGEKDRSQQGR